MKEIDTDKLMDQMRALAAQAKGLPVQEGGQVAQGENFSSLLQRAIESVNEAQKNADELTSAFEAGTPGVDLPQVMVASQKARVAFTAMVEVRNKLLEAYQEVMRMQV